MFKKGDIVYGMDFNTSDLGNIIELEIIGEDLVERENDTPLIVYNFLNGKEKGQVEKNFADKKLKKKREDLIKASVDKCNRFIKVNKQAIKEMQKQIAKAEKQILLYTK